MDYEIFINYLILYKFIILKLKKLLSVLFFVMLVFQNNFAQKIPVEKKADKLLTVLTSKLQLSEEQVKELKPLLVAYNAYKKQKKKEKKQRKKEDIKLSNPNKKLLKEEKKKEKEVEYKIAKILTTEQYK